MRGWLLFLLTLGLCLTPTSVAAQQACEGGGTCVAKEDLRTFLRLARDHKCRDENPPTFTLDPITIVVDKDGRIYGSGSAPKPYTVKMKWCNYEIDAKGQVSIVAAQRVESTYGFRFRPKASIGYLPVTALDKKDGYAGLDAGILVEPFFLSWSNVNIYIGVRSVGGGVGFDITKNMGLYLGYAATWGTWQHNPHVAVSFALWLEEGFETMKSAGRHLIIDGYVKNSEVFTAERLTKLFHDLAVALDMKIIQGPTFLEVELDPSKLDSTVFQDEGGITGSCIISTSHMALHAWPLRRFFSADVFSCKEFDTSRAMSVLHESLGFVSINVMNIDRTKPVDPGA